MTSQHSPARQAILVSVLVAAALAALAVGGLWFMRPGGPSGPLPRMGTLPEFSLTAVDGAPMTLDDLRGSPWIADFIFTRCTGVCPMLNIRMLALQEALPENSPVRLVSISVDPQHDTPEVLQAYARRNGADSARWVFLTGEWEGIRSLVGDGFRLAVSRSDPAEVAEGELVTHSDRLVLVDGDGEIRGYYHGSEDESVKLILEDLERLAS